MCQTPIAAPPRSSRYRFVGFARSVGDHFDVVDTASETVVGMEMGMEMRVGMGMGDADADRD